MARFRESGKPQLVGQGRIEITALRKSGEEFPIEISIGEAQHDKGRIFISYLRDITQRKVDEDALTKARDDPLQADATKTNFLAVMSHKMRTPLNGVFGAIDLLRSSKPTQDQSACLDIAQRSPDTLLSHVHDVLNITRIDAGKLELSLDTFDLRNLILEICSAHGIAARAENNQRISICMVWVRT